MRPVICFEMLYPGESTNRKVEKIAAHGFNAIEFWGWRDKDIPSLAETCRDLGIRVANFSGHRKGSPIAADTHTEVLEDYRDALATATALDCTTLMFLSNELGDQGRVVERYDSLSYETKLANFVSLLRRAAEVTPPEMAIVIEPLNTVVDHGGNFLSDMATAAEIVRRVDSSRVRILCDLYHMGMMGADLEALLRSYIEQIGYLHVADFPGRHEPGTGSGNWRSIFGLLGELEYGGDVGFEYAPEEDSDRSLDRIWALMKV